MKSFVEIIRFCARIIATPIFILAFGFCWIGFVFGIGTLFQIFSFLEDERFDWREHISDCNEFFCEPLAKIWKTS